MTQQQREREPVFCLLDGLKLRETKHPAGFDPYEGHERVLTLLVCPNWPALNHPTFKAGYEPVAPRPVVSKPKAKLGFHPREREE